MYREAARQIEKGLSLGARIALGVAALVFAALMLASGALPENAVFAYAFAGFSLAIAVACIARGRVRQFAGSVIGVGLFVLSLLYLASELSEGDVLSGSRSEPSVLNAISFVIFFGFPGIAYAFKARFGFRKSSQGR